MIPHPGRALPALLTLALALLAPLSAPAKELRHPAEGVPAYAIIMPDDWTSKYDAEGSLLLLSANRNAVVVLFVGASTEPLEKVATDAFAVAKIAPGPHTEPAEISGCEGTTWFGTMTNDSGIKLSWEFSIVRAGETHVASAALILADGMETAEVTTARLVRNGLKLIPVPGVESAPLPDPVLSLDGLEYYQTGGKEWTRYKYRVDNFAAYPNELFAPSPDLPPCGTNTKASRTWVDFYDETGKRLYGFCALGNSDSLNNIWFAVETSVAPPDLVYIVLHDRKTNTTYKSNLAPTTKATRSE